MKKRSAQYPDFRKRSFATFAVLALSFVVCFGCPVARAQAEPENPVLGDGEENSGAGFEPESDNGGLTAAEGGYPIGPGPKVPKPRTPSVPASAPPPTAPSVDGPMEEPAGVDRLIACLEFTRKYESFYKEVALTAFENCAKECAAAGLALDEYNQCLISCEPEKSVQQIVSDANDDCLRVLLPDQFPE